MSSVMWFALGAISCILAASPLIFLVPLFAIVIQKPLLDNLPLVIWSVGFSILGASFLNMANLFARLKRSNLEMYVVETLGRGFVGHVGWSGRSVMTNLHASVVRIAADKSGRFPKRLRLYAAATRYFNIFVMCYWLVVVVGILGLTVYIAITTQ